jgi:hypothetical protein
VNCVAHYRIRANAITIAIAFLFLVAKRVTATDYVAYSLRAAEAHLKAGDHDESISNLAGITSLAGMVIDTAGHDVILVGRREPNISPLRLDDLVVGMRALINYNEWPLVSLDNTPDTKTTRKQKVRFEGKVNDTSLGRSLLNADVLLKELALGKRTASIWGITSYAALCDEAARNGDKSTASVLFWFFPMNARLVEREGVFVVGDLSVGTRTQLIVPPAVKSGSSPTKDAMGEKFASDMTAAFSDLATQFPELRRIEQLYSAVALAHGLHEAQGLPDLGYFLKDYRVSPVETPTQMDVMTTPGEQMQLTGGVELRALLLRLQDGDVTALREAVTRSRPKGSPLSWPLPLSSWQIPGSTDTSTGQGETDSQDKVFEGLGVSINRQLNGGFTRLRRTWARACALFLAGGWRRRADASGFRQRLATVDSVSRHSIGCAVQTSWQCNGHGEMAYQKPAQRTTRSIDI